MDMNLVSEDSGGCRARSKVAPEKVIATAKSCIPDILRWKDILFTMFRNVIKVWTGEEGGRCPAGEDFF